ncbi:MAG: oxidoreductase, partial [Chitinophagaceae bacterium]
QKISLPLLQGKNSTGANAIAAWNDEKMMIVGGDFANDTLRSGNAAIVLKKGKKIITPKVPPFGYRSSVTFLSATRLIACGSSGVDISEDGGMHWRKISDTGYHVVKKAKKGNAVFLAGGNGRLATLRWP